MASSIIVGSVFFASDQLFRMEKLAKSQHSLTLSTKKLWENINQNVYPLSSMNYADYRIYHNLYVACIIEISSENNFGEKESQQEV
ncbi:hypothetical protein DOY81_008705 [Sarcophaga bullata]|nr:hypothetical protein DOY81_008705 [Sarcophaga bullata]